MKNAQFLRGKLNSSAERFTEKLKKKISSFWTDVQIDIRR